MSDKIKEYLGGFQQAAQTLTHIAGRTFTRQGIQQFWRRGDVNGFPEREARSINGHVRLLLDSRLVRVRGGCGSPVLGRGEAVQLR